MHQVRADIAPVDSLRIDGLETGDFAVVWAANDRAPVSTASPTTGAAVIWGDAIPGPGPERLDATGLLTAWNSRCRVPPPFDGFYAALLYDATHGITSGCDLLGFFPLYYAASSEVLVIGASPELFRHHPLFPAQLSLEGLTGILLTHSVFEGRSILSGVRRLRQGNVLKWQAGTDPVELVQYTVPGTPRTDPSSFSSDADELASALRNAIDRHVPRNGTQGILLSGGRDSRLLAGYLRERGDGIHALTLGSSTDYEMMCARSVARVLGCTHQTMGIDDERLPGNAFLQAKWEHLGSGFSSVHMWGAITPLRELPSRLVSGYVMEGRSVYPRPFDADGLATGAMPRGIPAEVLKRLLRADLFGGAVDHMQHRLQDVYADGAAIEEERPWRFLIAHDWRAHAGGVPWKLSFGSWPILPILDRELIATIATLPASSMANRRAQDEILRRRFPDLARLPLDRNSHDTLPLIPSATERVRHRLGSAMRPMRSRVRGTLERRYYHRVYDIDGPGWRGVRELAEPHRQRVSALVDLNVLAELVPPPEVTLGVENKVRDSFGTKQLIGLMLWSVRHIT